MRMRPGRFRLIISLALILAAALAGAVDLSRPAAAQGGIAPPVATKPPVGGNVPGGTLGNTSDTEIWRQVRRGIAGTVSIPQKELGVLIVSEGEEWRSIRNGPVTLYGGWILLGMVGVLAVFFAIRGRIRIKGGRSGTNIPRFTLNQRLVHWSTATLWIILGSTGLILLYGKHVLIPAIGPAAFGAIATAAIQAHNLFGPLFILAIIGLFFGFVKGNGPRLVDFGWFARGGGLLGGHAHAGNYNGGEKGWFWAALGLGIVLSVSGVILDFPLIAETRQNLQLANLAHAVGAILFIAFGLAHVYLGTIGMEGALEGMTRGEVDVNWAQEHHDLWAEEMGYGPAPGDPGAKDGKEAEARA
jgi:formate dehydrogenase subunit gamma